MKKLIPLLLICTVLVLSITGCSLGGSAYEESINIMNSDGSFTSKISESFNESYYDSNELMTMVGNEISEYNNANGADSIKVISNECSNGKFNLELEYKDINAFNYYCGDDIFVGTIQSAYNSGININRTLMTAGNESETINRDDLQNMADSKVVILNGSTALRVPTKVLYYSEGLTLYDNKTVVPNDMGNYFIIYK